MQLVMSDGTTITGKFVDVDPKLNVLLSECCDKSFGDAAPTPAENARVIRGENIAAIFVT